MSLPTGGSRDHLDHLPGRAYLLVVGAIPLVVLAIALPQLFSSHQTADVFREPFALRSVTRLTSRALRPSCRSSAV